MPRKPSAILTRREYEVMNAVWKLGEASVHSIRKEMGSKKAGAYTSLASVLRYLEHKGLVEHYNEGKSYVFRALKSRNVIQSESLAYVIDTFFKGNSEEAIELLQNGCKQLDD